MNGPTHAVLAIHNAFRRDIELIDAAALDAARGKPGLEATVERFRFLNEVLDWHAHGEDAVISPLLESVAPSVYETYERDHRALDLVFDELQKAVSVRDPLATARATKAFKFHLDLHLDKEDAHMTSTSPIPTPPTRSSKRLPRTIPSSRWSWSITTSS